MFARIVFAACAAGIVAGLVLSTLQAFVSTPLILEAETYESQSVPNPNHGHPQGHDHEHAGDHRSEPGDPWTPADGLQRMVFTSVANVGLAIGFALLLCALFAVRKPVSLLQGLGWGMAGYFAFFVSPSWGLHPELPGAAAADLVARQTWWLGCATSASVGIVMLVLSNNWPSRALGVVVIVIPHVWGAPQPELPATLVPLALEHQFVLATSVVNGVFWLAIGLISAYTMGRFERSAD